MQIKHFHFIFAGCIAFGINLLFSFKFATSKEKNEHMTLVHMLHVHVIMIYIETSNEIYYNDKTIPNLGILFNLCPSIVRILLYLVLFDQILFGLHSFCLN